MCVTLEFNGVPDAEINLLNYCVTTECHASYVSASGACMHVRVPVCLQRNVHMQHATRKLQKLWVTFCCSVITKKYFFYVFSMSKVLKKTTNFNYLQFSILENGSGTGGSS